LHYHIINHLNKDTPMVPRLKGPDFVGVGVQRAGTTWLAFVLAQHPEVLITKKEIDFFVRKFRKGYRWYHNWFRNKNGRMAGEITPNYIISPRPDSTHKEFYPKWNPRRKLLFWQKKLSARDELKTHYPGIRVFAIFRNPVDRAWSYYWFWKRRKNKLGKRVIPFERMWADDGRWIKTQGLYAHHLSYWREVFPDFGIFFYDDIQKDPVGLVKAVYRFIGVDDNFIPETNRWVNKGKYEPMPPAIREMLVDFYREQILKFSAMTCRNLSHWLKI